MEKSEIILRLNEISRILDMTPSEYADEWNKKHPDARHPLSNNDVWAFRTGIVQNEINRILKQQSVS